MNNLVLFSAVFIFSVFISSVSQIMLKKSAQKKYSSKLKEYMNPLVISAYFLFLISSFITVYAFKYVPLSMGPLLESTGYIFIAVLSLILLKERMRKKSLVGLMFIVSGIVISIL